MDNQEKIKALVTEMLTESYDAMIKNIDKVLKSGAVDVDGWNEKNAPMILPKTIVAALLQDESIQYEARGTSYEKKIKKDIKNIKYFI